MYACAYVKHVLTGDNSDIRTSISIRNMFVLLVLLLMLMSWMFSLAYADVYVDACAYALVKTSFNTQR